MKLWRMLLIFLVVMFMGLSVARADAGRAEAEKFFINAVKAYHEAHYADAVALNEAILAQGFSSPAVYYNLGNAAFKSRRIGKAILNYLRARSLAPRDSDIRANLSFARTMVENYAPVRSVSAFAPLERFFSGNELQWLALTLLALTGIFFLGSLYAGFPQKRVVQGTVLLVLVTGYFSAASFAHTLDQIGASVCVDKAEARFEPNAQATLYFNVPEGTEVRIRREKDGWAKIERSDGKSGWIMSALAEKI